MVVMTFSCNEWNNKVNEIKIKHGTLKNVEPWIIDSKNTNCESWTKPLANAFSLRVLICGIALHWLKMAIKNVKCQKLYGTFFVYKFHSLLKHSPGCLGCAKNRQTLKNMQIMLSFQRHEEFFSVSYFLVCFFYFF